jgi:hypothetical protein
LLLLLLLLLLPPPPPPLLPPPLPPLLLAAAACCCCCKTGGGGKRSCTIFDIFCFLFRAKCQCCVTLLQIFDNFNAAQFFIIIIAVFGCSKAGCKAVMRGSRVFLDIHCQPCVFEFPSLKL